MSLIDSVKSPAVVGEFDRCIYFTGWRGTSRQRESAGLARDLRFWGLTGFWDASE